MDAKNGPAGLNLVDQIGTAGPVLPGPIFNTCRKSGESHVTAIAIWPQKTRKSEVLITTQAGILGSHTRGMHSEVSLEQ